jgi:septum site-determining protein MinC
MRIGATLQGLSLRLDGVEQPEELRKALVQLPPGFLAVEVAGPLKLEILEVLLEVGRERSFELRPPRGHVVPPQTEVINRTLRSGQRVEATGTVIILGDLNAGAEVIAGGDIIVTGTLRGLAHAGAFGEESASIWAGRLEAKQLRIASAVAQAPAASASQGPERARLVEGQIVVEPWTSKLPGPR